VHNVLGKLEARGRGQAVARSRALGLIGTSPVGHGAERLDEPVAVMAASPF